MIETGQSGSELEPGQERLNPAKVNLFYESHGQYSDKLNTTGQLIRALLAEVREKAKQQGKSPIDVRDDVFLTLEGFRVNSHPSQGKGVVSIMRKRKIADVLVQAGIITKEKIEIKGRRNIRKINYRLRLTRECLLELEAKQDELPLYFNIAGGKIEAVYRHSQSKWVLIASLIEKLRSRIR